MINLSLCNRLPAFDTYKEKQFTLSSIRLLVVWESIVFTVISEKFLLADFSQN